LAIRSDPRDALTISGSGFNFGGRQQRLQILGSLERPQRDQDRSGKTRQLARIAVVFLWARDTGQDLNRRTVIPTLPSWKEG
jgi:hypothetical protein